MSHDEAIYSESVKNIEYQEDKKSVDEDKYSTTNLCYASYDMNFEANRIKTLYFEFDIRNTKDINMNSEHGEEMNDLTLLNIQDITQIIKNQLRFCDKIYGQAL